MILYLLEARSVRTTLVHGEMNWLCDQEEWPILGKQILITREPGGSEISKHEMAEQELHGQKYT